MPNPLFDVLMQRGANPGAQQPLPMQPAYGMWNGLKNPYTAGLPGGQPPPPNGMPDQPSQQGAPTPPSAVGMPGTQQNKPSTNLMNTLMNRFGGPPSPRY